MEKADSTPGWDEGIYQLHRGRFIEWKYPVKEGIHVALLLHSGPDFGFPHGGSLPLGSPIELEVKGA